ncbi:MAG: potassium-transporting ATPase subunit KdpC [Blastococcus sp.]|nr:potassium-transporting ATPase subunit KdpC [Blastococcus sp.]
MPAPRTGRQLLAAVRAMAVGTLVLGLAYPLLMTGVAQVVVPGRADGSLVTGADGAVVGSALIGQAFVSADGEPLAQYFQSRPSASGYDGAASGGSNLGPNSDELLALVAERRAAVAQLEGVDLDDVPPDAVTASASGLDPDISPEYAALQVDRVAASRSVDPEAVRRLVAGSTSGRDLGVVGAPHVRVLELNLALDRELGRAVGAVG